MLVRNHLINRRINPDNAGVFIDEDSRVATFLLYNLSGKIVGYQQYRPDSDKTKKNDPKDGRYYTYVSNEGEDTPKSGKKHIALYGTETINRTKGVFEPRPLFVVEGIFDAAVLHYHGYAAVAVLQNDPKKLKSFFRALNRPTIAICDGDDAGNKLGKIADMKYSCPKGHDLSSYADKDWEVSSKFLGFVIYCFRDRTGMAQ